MTTAQAMVRIRCVHTAISLLMAGATFILLYADISGASGSWLWIALALLGVERAVFWDPCQRRRARVNGVQHETARAYGSGAYWR